MFKEYFFLEEVIKEKARKDPIYYLANPGNYGDALIRYGTLKFFRSTGIKVIELSSFRRRSIEWVKLLSKKKGILIYGGGGAWCNLWNYEPFIKKIENHFKHIIVLPSTYEITPSLKSATYFVRDKDYSKRNVSDGFFCHDMAFYISTIKAEKGKGNGYFFRTDKESAQIIDIPVNNRDISTEGNQFSYIYNFLDGISKYSTIYTDRLHVSIAGALMGKEVHLYPGAYWKNKSIYYSSIKNNYNNFYMHEEVNVSFRNITMD